MGEGIQGTPPWAGESKGYVDRFNEAAKSSGITYLGDKPKGRANRPDVPLGEIKIDPSMLKKYGVDGTVPTKSTAKLDKAILDVMRTVELRRQLVAKQAYLQLSKLPSDSLKPEILAQLNPAEREWQGKVNPTLVRESLAIFGKQAHHRFELMDAWMRTKGDRFSKAHYQRMRSLFFPPLSEKSAGKLDFSEPGKYGNPFPWFPAAPNYNAMWPADLSKEELQYINNSYKLSDPIRQTYTVVERVDDRTAKQILAKPGKNSEGTQIEWANEGLDGRWYRVTNIAFHKRFRGNFLAMAEVLEENADVTVAGAGLHPQFRAFTLTMAEAFRTGEFSKLLKEDLEQTEGNLFISAFQHEGYWPDGTKFPLMLEVGVRDKATTDRILKNADIFQWLERDVASEVQKHIPGYRSRLMKIEDIQKSAALIWVLAYGGFLRAYKREPGGHDYPKRLYPGITNHRTVLALDVLKTWVPIMEKVGSDLLNPDDAKYMTFDGLIAFAAWHEGTHGTANRENTPTSSGKTMIEVFGDYWGLQAEPYADTGAFLILDKLHRRLTEKEYGEEVSLVGKALSGGAITRSQHTAMIKVLDAWRKAPRITEREYREGVMSGIGMELKRAWAKEKALDPDYQKGDPHGVGSSLMLGWLYENEVLVVKRDGRLHVDWDRIIPVTRKLRNKLVEFASKDNLDEFKSWVDARIKAFPDDLEKKHQQAKGAASTVVVLDRDFGLVPRGPEYN